MNKNLPLNRLMILGFLSLNTAAAMDLPTPAGPFPSKFAVYQQEHATCPFICWANLKKVRGMRRGENGSISLQEQDYVTKMQSYAWFLPRIRAYDKAHDDLRQANSHYAAYESDLRNNGIKSNGRFSKDGKDLETIDWSPLDQVRRDAYTPYNIKVSEYAGSRFIPVLVHKNQQYVYDYEAQSAKPLQDFTDDQLQKLGFLKEELVYPDTHYPKFGSEESYYAPITTMDPTYATQTFYNIGTYQHMLFACGVDRNNDAITEQSFEFFAYQEFHEKTSKNPLNPWCSIDKNDLFEFHLTAIFKTHPSLKTQAMKSVNYYNNCWKFYQESFELIDSSTPSTATKLSNKQKYMPVEDQCLAFYFSHHLRLLWAASISEDAVIAVTELENDLGTTATTILKTFSFIPGMPSSMDIIEEAKNRKYSDAQCSLWDSFWDQTKYSFLDTWLAIKPILLQNLKGKKDLVTFFDHGCVISFDPELIKLQQHEFPEVANQLGFEMWESLYDKGLKPFYQTSGTERDLIRYS